ncbi:C4-dicarboxylate ABC transporter substrate-binding protein [Halomonas sp. S2151]|uniref:TRAP transporter substrate-binding protein n=3 Tax=Halomonas TaxID=2745 RepID=A0AAU7KHD6_9GAMM|nr:MULTISPECIES: TRAP transporter substrate-binding protein [Halomonas]MBR9771752.1 TRAP transporter substrate-binding protein [Gammaproteobacteria bacterium]HAR08544.1 C4-dicarboxylate ABC transporter substrate-binding protein [Cobetia sp.]KJZ16537.1 C4-dicarboxylate ABC transporter substrate-binding protein [Halomonas sp. S2151]MAR73545.1 C4-dicarboxylate ABC transporter substrate-binding protein [Halomonas sp.]MBR9881921.1 TRAP transporter substrate-binding protein [Gammaproteobacteria bact
MTTPSRLSLLGAGALALGLCTPLLAQAEDLRFGGNFTDDHSSSRAMARFAETLAEQSDGDLTAQLFPNMQLGGAGENLDQVSSGAIMGSWIGISYLSRTVPELEALSLPFAFDSREDAFALIDGEVGELLDEKLAEAGFVALGYMELGFRHVTNAERPLESIEDFQDLKIRLQPNQTHLDTFRAIGANPVSMDIKEVYGALQQGVLDGQENPYSIIETKRLDEVQPYLSDTGHFYDYIVVVANRDKFEDLSDDQRATLMAAMDEAVAWQRETAAAEDTQARDTLIERGMQFTPISDETRAALREASQSVVDDLREKLGAELVDKVLEELGA